MDKDVVHIYNEIELCHKKNKIMPFSATWVDLEIIILSEVSQTKTNMISHVNMQNLKNDTDELI